MDLNILGILFLVIRYLFHRLEDRLIKNPKDGLKMLFGLDLPPGND